MIKVAIISVLTVFGIAMCSSSKDSNKQISSNISEYTECMNSPNTRFMAGMHQQKYPNVSIRQISHILCEKK